MITTVCNVHVKDDRVDAFREASLANARGSREEPGVLRFDVLQQADDPTRFILYEEYADADATQAHKQTPHYLAWREAVADMMATPRVTYSFGDPL